MSVLGTIGVIALLILVGACFSGAEMALVSLRDAQVRQLAHQGKAGAAIGRLAANPNRYLSTVQVGVTLTGFLSAAFGGDALGSLFGGWLSAQTGLAPAVADPLGIVLVTIVISYFSIVFGELVSKRLAMQRAESFALVVGRPIDAIAAFLRPVIWVLDVSTNFVVRVLGGDPAAGREAVSDEELRSMVVNSSTLGQEERQIVDDVFSAGERSLREVMVPRTEADFLPGDMPAYKAIRAVQHAAHSRYPVTGDSADDIVGFVHVRDLMDLDTVTRHAPVAQLARPVLSLPDTVKVLHALTQMRKRRSHLAIVRDEYGGTAGIVTLEDLLEELIGEINDEYDVVDPTPNDVNHVDGLMTLEEFEERSGYVLPEGPYDTVAGFVMAQAGQLPAVGDVVEADLMPATPPDDAEPAPRRFEFRVTELDGRRAARFQVRAVTTDGGR